MSPRALAAAALLGAAGLALAAAPLPPPTVTAVPLPSPAASIERRLALMGTSLGVEVEAADRATALAASERAVTALEAAEARLSTWREGTELARLNRAPVGAPVALSAATAADLAAARRCWEETRGAFDPTVGALVGAWGLRREGRIPGPDELAAARAATGMAGLALGPGGTAVRRVPGLVVEEGGFGKGAGLRDALSALEGSGAVRAALDLGGQVAVWGEPRAGWTVEVAHPSRRDRPVLALAIDRGSVATSGNSERGIRLNGETIGHLLDPRTGRPAPDFGSLTVWADDPLFADCLSTGLYVLGPEAALAWAAAHPGIEVLVLAPRGEGLTALASPGLEGRIAPLAGEIEVRFAGG